MPYEGLGTQDFFSLDDVNKLPMQFNKIQQEMALWADGFYWLNYMSPKRGNRRHKLTLILKENERNSAIEGRFSSSNFYSVRPGVYVSLSESLREGIEELNIEVATELRAVTYYGSATPQYSWQSSNNKIVAINPNPVNSSVAVATAVGTSGQKAVITVTDSANKWTKQLAVEIMDLLPLYFFTSGQIRRAALDGTNIQDLVTKAGAPQGIALDVAGGKMYWTDGGKIRIRRAALDGTSVQDFIREGITGAPQGIALDVAGGKIYWANTGADKIQRANLDGTNIQDLVTEGLESPRGIALDVAGGKMYWTDSGTDKIQRANLDGTNIQDLVTEGLESPQGIALDVAGGKMYWTDVHTKKIQRAALDGTNIQDLVTKGLRGPIGIALDVAGGKMYWTDLGTDKIQRANLDGTNIQDLVTELSNPEGIALILHSRPASMPNLR